MSSLQELLDQRAALERQIEEAQRAAKSGALAQIRALMSDYGLTIEDLGGNRGASKRRGSGQVAPKYRNPETGATWTGRGRAPTWIAGKDRDAFLIGG